MPTAFFVKDTKNARLHSETVGGGAAGGADRFADHVLDDLCLGRSRHRHRRRGRARRRHRGDPQVLRLRPADRGAVFRLARRRAARRLRPLLSHAPAGRGRHLRPAARHHRPGRRGHRLCARARDSAGRAGGRAPQQHLRPLRPDGGGGRPGHAELLVRPHAHPVARRQLAAAADHRIGYLGSTSSCRPSRSATS